MGVLYSNLTEFTLGIDGIEYIMEHAWDDLRPPVSSKDMKNIPFVSITEQHVGAGLECPVCKDDYNVGEKVQQLQCKHLFHTNCILPWLKWNATCPLCRKSLRMSAGVNSSSSSSSSSQDNQRSVTN